ELGEEAARALLAKAQNVARLEPLRRLDEGAPARAVEAPVERRLDRGLLAAADAPAGEACRDDAGVVDHERVASAQQLGQVAHGAIVKLRTAAGAHDQQPGRVP